jgi:hypothetical protein
VTAQSPERLHYQGEELAMCTEPLSDYFHLGGLNPGFTWTSTALWRGYVGSWEIVVDRLYLVAINGLLADGTEACLSTIFPGFPDRVFAHWYSGTIRIPQGKQLEYVHGGYASIYERDLLLDVERGVVVDSRVHHNGIAQSDSAPEGYGIGGMTVLPRDTSECEEAR